MEAPIRKGPEVPIGIFGVNGQIRRHMDEGGKGEEEEELAPCFPSRCESNHGQRRINRH